jgi:hypothetical protein
MANEMKFSQFTSVQISILKILKFVRSAREKETEKETDASKGEYFAYKHYMVNNGVHPLMMRSEQADFSTLSALPDAQLFYLAFCFVDGDGIDNGIARMILSYLGRRTSGGKKTRKKKKKTKMTASGGTEE